MGSSRISPCDIGRVLVDSENDVSQSPQTTSKTDNGEGLGYQGMTESQPLPNADEPALSTSKRSWKNAAVALGVVACVSTTLSLVMKYDLVMKGVSYVDENDLGVWGGLVYIAIFVASSVLFLPQTFVEVAAGVIWSKSFSLALFYAWFAKQLSSWVCFFLGRRIRRLKGKSKRKRHKIIEALKKVIKQKPDLLTALVCAAYVPASIKNYGLGTLPDVKFFRHFVPWTGFCGLPFAAANVFLGVQAQSLSVSTSEDNQSAQIMLACFGLVTIVGLTILGYFTKRQLDNQIAMLSDLSDLERGDGEKTKYKAEGGGDRGSQ